MRLATVSVAFCLAFATPATGDIYRWTDADGSVHFTHDLGQIPAEKRSAARAATERPAGSTLQTYSPPSDGAARRREHASSAVLRIPFERRGTLMLVDVRLNDRVRAPFLVDTGASGVLIPQDVASQLGIRIGPETPRMPVQTANGVIAEPVVALESVEVGSARVEGLEAMVSSSMSVGLLGGAFFNNFVYQIDAASSEITLVPNERVRAGLSEAQWRERFRGVRDPLGRLEDYLGRTQLTDDARLAELERRRAELGSALERLEREADLAQVPQAWRE